MKILTRLFCLFICTQFSFAQIEVSPSTLDFGDVLMGNSPSMTFTITSTLEQTVTITPPAFYVVDITEIEMVVDQTQDVVVTFTPPTAGNFDSQIVLSGSTFGNSIVNVNATGSNDISGFLSGVITAEYSPYFVAGDIVISEGDSLIIEPGVELIFKGNYAFSISGTIVAIANPDSLIKFYGEEDITWKGITTYQAELNFQYCVFKNVYNAGETPEDAFIYVHYDEIRFGYGETLNWIITGNGYSSNSSVNGYTLNEAGESIEVQYSNPILIEENSIADVKMYSYNCNGTYEVSIKNLTDSGDWEIIKNGNLNSSNDSSNWYYGDVSLDGFADVGDIVEYKLKMTVSGGSCSEIRLSEIELFEISTYNNREEFHATLNVVNSYLNISQSLWSNNTGNGGYIINIENEELDGNTFLKNIVLDDNSNSGSAITGENIIILNSIITDSFTATDTRPCFNCYYNNPFFIDDIGHIDPIFSPCVDAGDPDDFDACMPPGNGTMVADIGMYGGLNNCGNLESNMLDGRPTIDAIVDIPQDQGGFVGIQYEGSVFDYEPGAFNIERYSFWRELDVYPDGSVSTIPNEIYFVNNREEYWEFIGDMPSQSFQNYGYTAPTLADSTASGMFLSTFLVIAHTDDDDIFFTSDPASGYSVDNLAPTIPQQFSADNNGVDQVTLSWEYETEDDFSHHEFNSLWNDTQTVTDSFYVSSFTQEYDEYYLKSIDVNGNISDASPITSVHRFSEGANLVSFNSLPNQSHPATILGDVSYGMIGEGAAASNIGGTWVGSLTNMNQCDGYWVFTDNDVIHAITGTKGNCDYPLHEGANLKGYPCEYPVEVISAIQDECVSGLIGEGVAVIKIGDNWYGSLQSLYPGDAHWITTTCEIPEFTYNCTEPVLGRQAVFTKKVPEGMEYNQSTEQAFYFIEDVKLENGSIELGDWILAYHNEILVGARMWSGEYTDIPVMGTDGNTQTQNYISEGEIPVFKVMSTKGDMQELTGELKPWSTGDLNIVSTLSTGDYLPHQYRLSTIYPNPFNPSTTINFELPNTSEVKVAIYNLQGSEITTLLDAEYDAGYHSIVWDASEYASGVYFVKMISTNYIDSRKIMLVK